MYTIIFFLIVSCIIGYIVFNPKLDIVEDKYKGVKMLVLWYNADVGKLSVKERDFKILHEW